MNIYKYIKKHKIKIQSLVIYGLLVFFGISIIMLFSVSLWIGFGLQTRCNAAKLHYKGDCVEALTSYVDDKENRTLQERNNAIWALGHIGDKRALPVLEKYSVGGECDHERYVCQYELEKAKGFINGKVNIPRFIWNSIVPLE
ncbi:HEAT repeat domain-containing protein [Patescibacteria group bacterium]